MTSSFAFPEKKAFQGLYCLIVPYNDGAHGAGLWSSIKDHDTVFDFLPYGPWDSEELFREWLSSTIAQFPEQICLAIICQKSAKPLGCLWLHDISATHGTVEIGGIIYSPALQRTCMSTEAFYLLASYIFDELSYRRLQWRCNLDNEKSKKAALRFGFTFEGIFRQHMLVKGKNRDTAWYSMLDCEWPAQKENIKTWLNPANFDSFGRQLTPLTRNENHTDLQNVSASKYTPNFKQRADNFKPKLRP